MSGLFGSGGRLNHSRALTTLVCAVVALPLSLAVYVKFSLPPTASEVIVGQVMALVLGHVLSVTSVPVPTFTTAMPSGTQSRTFIA